MPILTSFFFITALTDSTFLILVLLPFFFFLPENRKSNKDKILKEDIEPCWNSDIVSNILHFGLDFVCNVDLPLESGGVSGKG